MITGTNISTNSFVEGLNTDMSPMYMKSSQYTDLIDINILTGNQGKTGDLRLISTDLESIPNIVPSAKQLVFAKAIGDYLIVCYELDQIDYKNVIVQYKFDNGQMVEGPTYLTGTLDDPTSNIRFGRTYDELTGTWSKRGIVDTEIVYTKDDNYKLYITDGLGLTNSINVGLNPRTGIVNKSEIQTDTTLSGNAVANVTVDLNTLTRVGSLGLPVGDHNIILRISRLGLLYDFIQLPGSIKLSNLSIDTIQDGSTDSSNQLINLSINNKGNEIILVTIYDVYYNSFTNYTIKNYGSIRVGKGVTNYTIDNNKLISDDVDESDVQSIANLIFNPTYVTSLNGRNYYANGTESSISGILDRWDLFTMQYKTNNTLENTLNIGSLLWLLRGNYSNGQVTYQYNDTETHDSDRFDMTTGALLPLELLRPGLILTPLDDNYFLNPSTQKAGGIGKNIEYSFTLLRLLSDNAGSREGIDGQPNSLIMGHPEVLPHPSKKCNYVQLYEGGLSLTPTQELVLEYDDQSSYYWDYHNYILSSKYVGYQRDSVYPFAVQLTYNDGSKSLLKFIGYIKTPSGRTLDYRLFDYHDLNDTNENHAVSSYPLGITFTLNNLALNVENVTIFRGKRTQSDRPLFGTGIISPMTKMVDGSYGLSTIFTSNLSYSVFGFLEQQYKSGNNSSPNVLTSAMYTDVIRAVPYGEKPTMFLVVSPDISYTENVPGLYNIEIMYGLGTRVGEGSDQVTPTGGVGLSGITPKLILRQANSTNQTVVAHDGMWHGFGSVSKYPWDKRNASSLPPGFTWQFNEADAKIPEVGMSSFWSRLSWSVSWDGNSLDYRNRYSPPNVTNCLNMTVCDASGAGTLAVRVRPVSSYTDFTYSNPLVEIEPTNPRDTRTNGSRFGVGFINNENYNTTLDNACGSLSNWFGYKLYKPYTSVWAYNITPDPIPVTSNYNFITDTLNPNAKILLVKSSQVLDMLSGLSFLTYVKTPLFIDGTRFYNNVLDYVHTEDENQKLEAFFSYGGETSTDSTDDRIGWIYYDSGSSSAPVITPTRLPYGNSSRKLIVKIDENQTNWSYNVPTSLRLQFYNSTTDPVDRVWDLQYLGTSVESKRDLIQYASQEGDNYIVTASECGGTTEAMLSTLIVNLRQNVSPFSGLSSFGLSLVSWVVVGSSDEITSNQCKLTVFNGDTYVGPYLYNHRYALNEILENEDQTFNSNLDRNAPLNRVNSLSAYHFYWYMAESSVNPGLVSGLLPKDVTIENGIKFDQPQTGQIYKYNPRASTYTLTLTDITQNTKLYLYNTLFSQDGYPSNITYNEEVDYAISNTTTDYPYRIWLSQLDTSYDPLEDGRLFVKVSDYIDVDLKYGEITSIVPYNSYIVLFQERGTSIVTTLDRDVVTTENSLLLTIGTGQLLSRYDYLSEIYGKPLSVTDYVKDQTGIWWYDRDNNEACYLTGNRVLLMSTTLTVKSLHNKIMPTETHVSYDSKDNEIYFSHYNDDTNTLTLRYSDLLKSFISTLSDGVRNTVYFQHDLYKINTTDLLQHELGFGYKKGTVQFIAGNTSGETKVFDTTLVPVFDTMNYALSLTYNSELNQFSRVINVYSQDSGEIQPTWVNGRNREGVWYIPTRTETYPDRLRGRYLTTTLEIQPITMRISNVNISNVSTTFRQSKF